MTVVDGSIVQSARRYYFYLGIRIINPKTHFHRDEKLFELFCIENDFAKYFANFAIYVTATGLKPRTTQFVNQHSTISPN